VGSGNSEQLDWSTPGFLIRSTVAVPISTPLGTIYSPIVIDTGRITDSVSLATLGLSPNDSFDTMVRVGEPYFHEDLSNQLFGGL
jgi:hypothetical protein